MQIFIYFGGLMFSMVEVPRWYHVGITLVLHSHIHILESFPHTHTHTHTHTRAFLSPEKRIQSWVVYHIPQHNLG